MHPHRPRILIVEDEFLIAVSLQDMLAELGCGVVEPAGGLARAVEAAATAAIDAAVLNFVVDGAPADAVAEALSGRGIPFGFATGMNQVHAPERWRSHPYIAKPYSIVEMRALLRQILPGHGIGLNERAARSDVRRTGPLRRFSVDMVGGDA